MSSTTSYLEAAKHWQLLDSWLHQHRPFWIAQPFTSQPDWTLHYPEMAAWLENLGTADCENFEQHPDQLCQPLQAWLPALADRSHLLELPLVGGKDCSLPEKYAKAMPGRKRLQAGALVGALLPLPSPIFDWCSGSGHLARTLAAQTQHPVLGLEKDIQLVNKGNQLAEAAGDAVRIQQQDVLAFKEAWPQEPHGVALHACGDLHRQLIKKAIQHRLPRLSFSPCCYHLIAADSWQPLSQQAKNSLLQGLDKSLLRLAVQETVTAPERVARQRDQLKTWRLGFDALQRQLFQQDQYLPLPSVSPRWLQGSFADFCRWAAEHKGLQLPPQIDFSEWEERGEKRLIQVQRHELLRHLFRRPLEIWLVLDYVLALEEAGYQVKLGHFCKRELTPRNLLIDAWLPEMKMARSQEQA
ncbi:Methyltransferase domain-containing protein [Marinospirillum celere]|uniref:Methyltransferase domain-containing protein n=1 Tax=Marinospirillum celere TaxID=1122252 RepID=A0A1I1DU99_9GAMM|nr:methyltransferase [Marinospirillum celere]SFB78444.1 Methyltransferase domain-containing protein [Marinospirillum celere]